MHFKKIYFTEDDTALSTDVKDTSVEFQDRVKRLLQDKFAQIGKAIKEVTHPATKGARKGLLIFNPDAARKIYQIKDKFVQYVTRDIYDHYRDIVNGVFWQMHMNWLFGSDIVMELARELNDKLKGLQDERDKVSKYYMHQIYGVGRNRFSDRSYYMERNPKNVFRRDNPISEPYWNDFDKFVADIRVKHPRVPERTLMRFIDDNYDYRLQLRDMKQKFLDSLPEYQEAQKEWKRLEVEEKEKMGVLDAQIKQELGNVNYEVLKKQITPIVEAFVKKISQAMVTGDL